MTEKKGLREAYGETLAEIGEENEQIVVLDADLSGSTKTSVFAKKFPERFFNMGIAEQDMIGTAAGFASSGKTAFASTFAVFATGRAWEQIRQSVCLANLNVKIVATHGGLTVGPDGSTHQALEDVSVMRVLPNMRVIVPADAHETAAVIRFVAENEGPFYVRLTREKFPIVFEEKCTFRLGKWQTVQEGKDVTVVACGLMVSVALEAGKLLERQGISLEVLNASSVKPHDADALLTSAKKTGRVVTLEEHSVTGALGSTVAESLGEHLPTPLKRLGVQNTFGITGAAGDVLAHHRLTAEDVAEDILRFIK